MDYMYMYVHVSRKNNVQSYVHWVRDQMAMLIKNNNTQIMIMEGFDVVKGNLLFPNNMHHPKKSTLFRVQAKVTASGNTRVKLGLHKQSHGL